MDLERFPRVSLAHLPTPLEPLPRLSQALGGKVAVWVKRDDCTGLAGGGNKTRKLEFLMAAARDAGADTVVTAGGTQSNHVRQTVAAAARLGLAAEAVLERIHPIADPAYDGSGNLLLDNLMGARLHDAAEGEDVDAAMARVADDLRARGQRPYVIPVGGSNPVGALGYVGCALELAGQLRDAGIGKARLFHASGSGGTQAGLLVGLAAAGVAAEVAVQGICNSRAAAQQRPKVAALLAETLDFVGMNGALDESAVLCDDAYLGGGYGVPSDAMREALSLAARREGLLLDPVYTGKAMAGLIGWVRDGRMAAGEAAVLVHTGGQPALFAYGSELA